MTAIPSFQMSYIDLMGDNLRERHYYYNELVTRFYEVGVPFIEIVNHPEKTPADRLLKIDLACKLRYVDFLLDNIKDEDMLYVSRALRADWFFEAEYKEIIEPKYLEEKLYPHMITTAVSKFKNWIYLNLKDPKRCEEFYKYYKDANFNYAIKFLGHCSVDFITEEAPNIVEKITPHHFKVLCEKCPQVAKIYFDSLPQNETQKMKFLDNHLKFFNSLKVVLKLDADIFFEIAEKYFDIGYGRSLTKYIMTRHRNRFNKKPELYAGKLLHIPTVANCLNLRECRELVLKLARASYLSDRIDYKFVEPLINRFPIQYRPSFKKRVFVEKNVGELVETWPYEIPALPKRNPYQIHVFADKVHPNFVDCNNASSKQRRQKRRCGSYEMNCVLRPIRTYLDRLFDAYRFVSFERTLFELRRKIKEDSSSQNRQYMMLVLVSKSRGQTELVMSLLRLLKQHLNEPAHVRAAVIRSLVKRAAVWRLPQSAWEVILRFARGLGLDGATPEADCREGLHAVVIRSLLERGACTPAIRDAFMVNFSHLEEYSLDAGERMIIRKKLISLLVSAAEAADSTVKLTYIYNLIFDMLQRHNISVACFRFIPAVTALAKRDFSTAEPLLRRLFNAKVARRSLFRENFPLFQTDASYLNALRHDTSVINVTKFVDLVDRDEIRPEQFLRKMAVYFTESQGLMELYRTQLRERVLTNPTVGTSIARPLSMLQGACLIYLQTLDVNNESVARLASAIKANMHVGRPKLDINSINLPAIGAKAVANKVLVCRSVEVENYIDILMNWNRTVKLALVLSERIRKEANVFASAAALRPTATLKAALKYLHRRGDDFDPRVWEITKQLMKSFDWCSLNHIHIRESFTKLEKIPAKIKPAYCAILFRSLKKENNYDAMSILSELENLLPDVEENFLEQELLEFLQEFKYNDDKRKSYESYKLYLRVLTKFLLLCKSEEIQEERCKILCEPLLRCFEMFLNKSKQKFMDMFDVMLLSLQYNKVFFDDDYVSPLPILKHIVSWMRQYLPIETHFGKYVCIHLVMLYLKSVRQCVKLQPEIFKNEKRKLIEGVSIVGHVFGMNIARDIKQLTESFFESAIELYRPSMEEYFSDYFDDDVTKFKFIKGVVKGILRSSVGDEVRLALYILTDINCNFDPDDIRELIGDMKMIADEKFKYFLYYELYYFRNYLVT